MQKEDYRRRRFRMLLEDIALLGTLGLGVLLTLHLGGCQASPTGPTPKAAAQAKPRMPECIYLYTETGDSTRHCPEVEPPIPTQRIP